MTTYTYCKTCNSINLVDISAKSSDLNIISKPNDPDFEEIDGYIPEGFEMIGGGDYVEFIYCQDCGQIQ